MSEMVERVAEAAYRGPYVFVSPTWDDADPAVKDRCREFARIVLAAMREPTVEMVDAAMDWGDDIPRRAWQSMIDAALNPQTPLPDHQSDIASHDNGSSPQI